MAATIQTFLSFAYGSNMLTRRIQKRCPHATALGMAELRGYKLKWHKESKDKSGKCDVEQTDDATKVVFGVLYEIPVDEKTALDAAEGLGSGYEAITVEVTFKGAPRMASVYIATEINPCLKPYTWYKRFVVEGAREHDLPRAYIDGLATTDAIEDPDRERHNRNWQTSMADRGEPRP